MGSPRLLPPARPVALAAALLALSGAALPAAEVAPVPAAPKAELQPVDRAIQGAIALVHDGAGFSGEFPIGTFSDGKPDTRQEIARAARSVPEVVAAAVSRLDPAAPPAAERANEAAKLRLATFAGEHSFRRALAWYEPLLMEVAADMPEPKLTAEQFKALRAQLREWQAKSATYREWARKRGGDLKPAAPAKPGAPQGRGPFADVPLAHPAYGAVQVIASAGVFTGYPDNTFSGKRALTRYEFAVALQRMLQDIQRAIAEISPRPQRFGDPGVPAKPTAAPEFSRREISRLVFVGPPGLPPRKPSVLDPAQLPRLMVWIRALAAEFDTELAMLGSDVEQIGKNLDAVDQRLEKLKDLSVPGKPQGPAGGSTL